jgi:hypothetical protein
MSGQKSYVEFLVSITVHRARRGTSCRAVDPYGRLWIRLFADKASRNKGVNLPTSEQRSLTEVLGE